MNKTDKQKWPLEIAMLVADEIVAILKPDCQRIAILGSLRRQKPQVGDIEILFSPKYEERRAGLFDTVRESLSEEAIQRLLDTDFLSQRPNVNGGFTWGRLNKLAIHRNSGIPVDLFCEPDVRDWPRSMAIRTGPKEFNIELMATAPKVGYIAHAYGEALHKASNGERFIVETEREFIEVCGLKYLEPKDR
jgi:DNA polymerase/3'-5' exonuclease PolX